MSVKLSIELMGRSAVVEVLLLGSASAVLVRGLWVSIMISWVSTERLGLSRVDTERLERLVGSANSHFCVHCAVEPVRIRIRSPKTKFIFPSLGSFSAEFLGCDSLNRRLWRCGSDARYTLPSSTGSERLASDG